MFAGGRCTFHTPLHFSEPATATSSLANSTIKRGNSGELLFVTVRTTITQNHRLCITDEQDLVYRSGLPKPVPAPAATLKPRQTELAAVTDALSRRRVAFDPVTLFRFSALTANSHRIHYDQAYARDVEGYAGLLVHGPLLVLSMAQLLRAADPAELASVSYRLHQPVFSGESLDICLSDGHGDGEPPTRTTDHSPAVARVTILDATGGVRASARAQFQREPANRS
jgi:3-methylfumaryl-CoA hydratase